MSVFFRKMNKEKLMSEGFSLVELIIVMAIMAVLVGGTALGISFLYATDAKEVAYEINSGLTDLKSRNMAGSSAVYLHINKYNGSYYLTYTDSASFTPDGSGKELCGDNFSFKTTYNIRKASDDTDQETEDRTLSDKEDICIGVLKKDGSFLYQNSGSDRKEAPCVIQIIYDNETKYTVYLVTDTGKHYVEVN